MHGNSEDYPISVQFSRKADRRWQADCHGTSPTALFSDRFDAERFVRDWFAYWSEHPLPINEVRNASPDRVIPVTTPDRPAGPVNNARQSTPREPQQQPLGIVVGIGREPNGRWVAQFRIEVTQDFPDLPSAKRAVRAWVRHWANTDIPIYHTWDNRPWDAYVPVQDSIPGG